jgi:hypothetical protein
MNAEKPGTGRFVFFSGMFTPAGRKGSSKYGNLGKVSETLFKDFNLSKESREALAAVGNYGLARSTWSSYSTAERMLATCASKRKRKMELPLSQDDLLEFIGWLISERNVKAGTVSSYLSGIRQMHILKGMEPPTIRTSLVRFLLQGKGNMDNIAARSGGAVKRLPITMNVMRLLKEEIKEWKVDIDQKLLMWAISTVAFHGAFRIHELLCKVETTFDPDFALLGEDIKLKEGVDKVRILEVKLKCPKENRTGKAVIIDIFETGGTLCPVKAFTRWWNRTEQNKKLPVFRNKTGVPVTGAKMNQWLRLLLGKHVNPKKGKFSGHSFRIGLATTLGSLGFSNDDIKEAGRWSSNVYEVYMQLPRRRRLKIAEKISKLD